MNTTSRAGRVAVAQQLRDALRRTGIDDTNETPPAPPGNCGRGPDEACGMIDPEECKVHASPAADDPALLSYAGTLASRKQQLKAARQQGRELRRQILG
jgi:hypothetical protein